MQKEHERQEAEEQQQAKALLQQRQPCQPLPHRVQSMESPFTQQQSVPPQVNDGNVAARGASQQLMSQSNISIKQLEGGLDTSTMKMSNNESSNQISSSPTTLTPSSSSSSSSSPAATSKMLKSSLTTVTCDQCRTTFPDNKALNRHASICPKMPVCCGCDKVFETNESREDHLLVCSNQRITIGEKSPVKVAQKDSEIVNCPKCGQVRKRFD